MYYTLFILPQADLEHILSNIGGPSYLDDHPRQKVVSHVYTVEA